ncbi:MAG: SRPBCC family protein, partial [Bacteroidia bacterium]|nr:SRPBCC family protein [Bacteroidia bacterium]
MKKFAKRFGIFLLFVVVVYLVLCIFGPKENGISRTVSINASPEVVSSTMGDYKFFVEKWSPWTEKDPNAKITYTGDPKTVGHKYTWEGNDSVGSGSMTVDSISANRVVTALEFLKPFKSSNKMWLDVQPDGAGSKVEWKMRGEIPFMMRGMMMFMNFEKIMAPDFDKGAKKMKEAIEGMA